jgi:hypothetical protein
MLPCRTAGRYDCYRSSLLGIRVQMIEQKDEPKPRLEPCWLPVYQTIHAYRNGSKVVKVGNGGGSMLRIVPRIPTYSSEHRAGRKEKDHLSRVPNAKAKGVTSQAFCSVIAGKLSLNSGSSLSQACLHRLAQFQHPTCPMWTLDCSLC